MSTNLPLTNVPQSMTSDVPASQQNTELNQRAPQHTLAPSPGVNKFKLRGARGLCVILITYSLK